MTFAGSPPSSAIASRMTARSTTAGTPVKSWRITRAGMNGTSASAATARPPRRQRLDLLGPDDAAAGVAEDVLEEDLERDRGPAQVEPVADRAQPEVVGEPGSEAGPGAEGVGQVFVVGHASSVSAVVRRRRGRVPRRTAARHRGSAADEGLGRPAAERGERPARDARRRGWRDGHDRGARGRRHRPRPAPAGPPPPRRRGPRPRPSPSRTSGPKAPSRPSSGSSARGRSARRWASRCIGPAGRSAPSRAATRRRRERFRGLVEGSRGFAEATALMDEVELILVAVPDDAVAAVAGGLRMYSGQAMVHTSGALDAAVLDPGDGGRDADRVVPPARGVRRHGAGGRGTPRRDGRDRGRRPAGGPPGPDGGGDRRGAGPARRRARSRPTTRRPSWPRAASSRSSTRSPSWAASPASTSRAPSRSTGRSSSRRSATPGRSASGPR